MWYDLGHLTPGANLETLLRDCLEFNKLAAWEELTGQLHRIIASSVIRTLSKSGERPQPELVDDLIQATYVRLCASDYRALRNVHQEPGSAFGLVRVTAATVTLDHLRASGARKRNMRMVVSLDDVHEPSEGAAGDRSVLLQQLDLQLGHLCQGETGARDRQIFWLYYRHGWTAREIAALPAVALSPKGVESTLHRLTVGLKEALGEPKGFAKGSTSL